MAFTSDLSVTGFTVARSAGLRPLRLVGGAVVLNDGSFTRTLYPRTVDPYQLRPGQAVLLGKGPDRRARFQRTALDRLREEAAACGAGIVTGVTVAERWVSFADDEPSHLEITARGTAMEVLGPRPGGAAGEPVLTSLSVGEYEILARQGYAPAGMLTASAEVMARSAWDIPPGRRDGELTLREVAKEMTVTQDRPEYADATRLAYTEAVGELNAAAAKAGAETLSGITVSHTVREEGYGFSVLAHATAEALVSVPRADGDAGPLTIAPVRRLND